MPIALTLHHGFLPSRWDGPPADYVEAVLGAVDLDTSLLKIGGRWSEAAQEWMDAPAKLRLIGPGIHELSGPSLRTGFDFVIHTQQVTLAQPLSAPGRDRENGCRG